MTARSNTGAWLHSIEARRALRKKAVNPFLEYHAVSDARQVLEFAIEVPTSILSIPDA